MVLNKLKVKENRQEVDLLGLIYKASHDLKGPLRTIKSFTQIISKNLQDRLKDEEKDLFKFVLEATDDLESLIVQLVTLSKVSQTPLTFGEVDLGNLIELLKLNFRKQIEESGAIINFNYNNEKVRADKDKINLVLENLIKNAIKFQHKDQKPEININIVDKTEFWEISITDNGIGIEEEHFEIIFLPFEKLHGNSEYKGSGIGLSICDRIIKEHKGTLFVTSELNKGSTFSFTLPK